MRPVPRQWPEEKFRQAIEIALAKSRAVVTLKTQREAEKFRFAFYHFRNRTDEGRGIRLKLENNKVIFTHSIEPRIEIE